MAVTGSAGIVIMKIDGEDVEDALGPLGNSGGSIGEGVIVGYDKLFVKNQDLGRVVQGHALTVGLGLEASEFGAGELHIGGTNASPIGDSFNLYDLFETLFYYLGVRD